MILEARRPQQKMNHSNQSHIPSQNRPLVIGIAGGSGSGKTHLANQIAEQIGIENVLVISMDQYFGTENSIEDAANTNFDHPKHLDIPLLMKHIRQLKEGKAVYLPGYDFIHMTRLWATLPQKSKPVIIIEGLFVLADPIVQICDLAYFLDVAADERLLGRILRDTRERGVKTEQVIDRYQRFVRPSYEIFVNPTKQNADMVVDYTYRRSMFGEFLLGTIRNFLTGKRSTEDFILGLRKDSYNPGSDRNEAYMPISMDLMQLAKVYPEKIVPIDKSRTNLASHAFNAHRDLSPQVEEQPSCLAV